MTAAPVMVTPRRIADEIDAQELALIDARGRAREAQEAVGEIEAAIRVLRSQLLTELPDDGAVVSARSVRYTRRVGRPEGLRRSVNRAALEQHEDLLPAGLLRRDVTEVKVIPVVYPTVAEMEKRAGELAAMGLTLEDLIVGQADVPWLAVEDLEA